MTIVSMKTLTGPNIWSVRRTHLVQMLIDIHELEYSPSSSIPGFYERMVDLMPSLYRHRCSEGYEGGFLQRVKSGTWMGHIIEHIALELQVLADMDAGFGRTRSAGRPGLYNVVYSFCDAEAGMYAGKAAVRIAEALVSGEHYDIGSDLKQLQSIWQKNKLGPSTGAIVQEVEKRNIPWMRLDDDSYIQLGYGKQQKRIEASIACSTSAIAVDLAGDKQRTKKVLADAAIPVPDGRTVSNDIQLASLIDSIGFPVAVKPLNGNHGKGITTNIWCIADAVKAFHKAKLVSPQVICEKHISGNDYRVLLVNYRFVAASLRTPAMVVGDGIHTIRQLVDIENCDCRRGKEHDNVLTQIHIDTCTVDLLAKESLTVDSIVPAGQEVVLKSTANLSTGGTAEDVTDFVHPENISLFERAARVMGLDICGIDVMAESLSSRLQDNGGAILEINAAPGLRMHLSPSSGQARNVAKSIVDMLYPQQAKATIPIVAVTGTNGKTTTTRLIACMMKRAGYFTGYTTTDGVYAGEEMIDQGDCSGPSSAKMILKDPAIEAAVFECARGGLLRSGLAFNACDVGVVTNVAADHLGLENINTLEDLADVKAVIAETVHENGVAVLNADDDLVYEMRNRVRCNVALFSVSGDSKRIAEHVQNGGTAAVLKNSEIVLYKNGEEHLIAHVKDVPLTFDGKALFNVANALGAVLAADGVGIEHDVIRQTLASFRNSAEQTPGRMNLYSFNGYHVMIDYAHNPHGLRAIGDFIKNFECKKRVGVVTAVGDRRDEDIIAMGEEAAKVFDVVIIRLDEDLRGRDAASMNELLMTGIRKVDKNKSVYLFDKEQASFEFGFYLMHEDYLLVMLVDKINKALQFVTEKMQAPVRALEGKSIAV